MFAVNTPEWGQRQVNSRQLDRGVQNVCVLSYLAGKHKLLTQSLRCLVQPNGPGQLTNSQRERRRPRSILGLGRPHGGDRESFIAAACKHLYLEISN